MSASGGRGGRHVGAEGGRGPAALVLFLLRRLVAGVLLLAAVAAATFVLITLAPGDTAQVLAGQSGADPAYLELIRERFGLDRPLPYQIASYLRGLARGDLGYSAVRGQPVHELLLERLPASLLLGGSALLLATALGILLGLVAAVHRGRPLDVILSLGSLVAYSIPVFWLGQLLVALFAVRLGWLPAGGMQSAEEPGGVVDVARHLVLPALTLAMLLVALMMRVTRAAAVDALQEDFVTVARAKGLTEARVLRRHVLRNALRPIVTVVTGYAGLMLTGAVLVETVFVWPGLGRLLYDSVLARDTPMLAAILLLAATVVVLANLAADLVYRLLDPRTVFA